MRKLSPKQSSRWLQVVPDWLPWIVVAGLLIAYVAVTEWLVSLGPIISPTLLVAQIAAYLTLAIVTVGAIWLLNGKISHMSHYDSNWVSILSIFSAVLIMVTRFFFKNPPSGWALNSAQDWRDIAEGYVVGRMIVPLTEELVFRGLLFCPSVLGYFRKPSLSVLISALIFAFLHWGPLYGFQAAGSLLDVVSALAAGFAFGTLRAWTGSILPGLGLHIIGNSIGF